MSVVKYAAGILVPVFILFVIIYGVAKRVNVYEAFCEGAKDGISVAVRMLPLMCAMLSAISVMRGSGLLDKVSSLLLRPLSFIGIPPEIVSLFIIRPFSGSASLGMLTDIFDSCGVNSQTALIASVLMGSTETTFYTIALYYGSVGIKKTRYTLFAAIFCDLTSLLAAVLAVRMIL